MTKRISRFTFVWLKSYLRRWWRVFLYNFLPRTFNKKPKAEVYLALNDPSSFMLIQLLPDLAKRFDIEFELYLVYENTNVPCDFSSWRKWLINNANLLARRYELISIEQIPQLNTLVTGQQWWQLKPKTIENALELFITVWTNKFDSHYAPSTPVINHQIKNQEKQSRRGHYQSATIFFSGEWYLGVERLDHLEHRLARLGLYKGLESIEYRYTQHHLKLEIDTARNAEDEKQPLDVYLSIRSPYSYLGWIQAKKISECYKVPLNINIVLPLIMRGVDISQDKQRYMLFDALREARVKNIPVGKFIDPAGQGVVNSYQLFPYAEKHGKAIEYIDALFEAVFVRGMDLAKTENLVHICQQIRLDYKAAIVFSKEHDWQQITDLHQTKLDNLGFWGVPCFTYDEVSCWGQDKLWQIEEKILNKAN